MRRLYRESHYANGTTESGGERAGLYQRAGRTSASSARTRTRRAGSRGKRKGRTSESSRERRRRAGERITHNLTEGRGADPAKKVAAQLFRSVLSPPPPLSALSALLFAMLISRARGSSDTPKPRSVVFREQALFGF